MKHGHSRGVKTAPEAMTLAGLDTAPRARVQALTVAAGWTDVERQQALSQWFTPADIAIRLVEWAGPAPGWYALEPSAGDGAIARLLSERCARVDAVELDPAFAARHGWECADYLARSRPVVRYDLAVTNPPYEGGLDGRFLTKAMDESERVIGLVRLAVLVGLDRHERIWSRVDGVQWSLAGLALLVRRPSFTAAGAMTGSPLSDFVAVKLLRGEHPTRVEWWV